MQSLNDTYSKMRFLPFVLFAALFPVLAPLPMYTPWLVASLCLITGMLGISFLSIQEDRQFLYKIFVGGYLLRILSAIFLYLMTCDRPRLPGFFIDDGWVHSANAIKIAERLRFGLPVIGVPNAELWSESGGIHYYDYINGGLYFLLGNNPLNMFFLNCFFGILASIFIYFIALTVFNRNTARLAAVLCAFWPSLILWSTQNLKEPLTILCVVLCFWAFVFFLKKFNPYYLIIVFLSLRFLKIFRPPMDKIVFAAFVLHLIFFGLHLVRKKPSLVFVAIPIFVLVAIGFGQVLGEYLELVKNPEPIISRNVQSIEGLRSVRASANLAFLPDYRINSTKRLLYYLPFGVFALLFAPFPWQIFSVSQIMAVPEMLVWYLMFSRLLKGVYVAAKKNLVYLFSIFSYSALMILMLACIEGNIGTMFRHRSMVLVFLLMFMAVGMNIAAKKKVQHVTQAK